MVTTTATEFSRNLSDFLDKVEAGESICVTRAGHVVGRFIPEPTHTARALFAALDEIGGVDPDFERDVTDCLDAVVTPYESAWDQ
jgi:prevent-host-death family protein